MAIPTRQTYSGSEILVTEESPGNSLRTVNERAVKDIKKDVKVFTKRGYITMKTSNVPQISKEIVRKIISPDTKTLPTYHLEIPKDTQCHSTRTEIYNQASFDCFEGIMKPDDKVTELYADRGKGYAYVETKINLDFLLLPGQKPKTPPRLRLLPTYFYFQYDLSRSSNCQFPFVECNQSP